MNVLLIEKHPDVRKSLRRELVREYGDSLAVTELPDYKGVREAYAKQNFDVTIAGQFTRAPELSASHDEQINGPEIYKAFAAAGQGKPLIFVVASVGHPEKLDAIMRTDPNVNVLTKPAGKKLIELIKHLEASEPMCVRPRQDPGDGVGSQLGAAPPVVR